MAKKNSNATPLKPGVKRKKIAIVVPNPCNPDYRVIRQAESLAREGHEVRLYATKNAVTPSYEEFNGVKYIRSTWNIARDYALYFTGLYKLKSELEPQRAEFKRMLEKAEDKRPSRGDDTL